MNSNPFDSSRSTFQLVESDLLSKQNITLYIKRDDLIHGEVSGNKWRKLQFNVDQCFQMKNDGILTFGGAFSNHLVATAAACNIVGLKSVGIVRGDELTPESNDTLKRCEVYGMQLVFISREEYGLRHERYYHEELLQEFPNHLVVPEGGANYLGIIGCQQTVNEIPVDFDRMIVAQGTTTTSCGLALSILPESKLSVVPALKGYDSIGEMRQLMLRSGFSEEIVHDTLSRVDVLDNYHFGGFGKYTTELLNFIRNFYCDHQIKLDPLYTGKAIYALMDQIKKGVFDGETIVFVHTGGLQGAQSIADKSGIDLFK